MKIAIIYDVVYPYIKGGVEKRIYEVSRRLKKKHEIHLFCMKFWKGQEIIIKNGVYLHGVCKPRKLYINKKRYITQPIYFSLKLFKPLMKEDFDIIECQNFPYFPCFIAKLYSVIRKKPLIITWHEVWKDYWYGYLGAKGFFGKVIERITSKLTKNVIAVSKKTKQKLINLGVKEKDIKLIPNGVNLDLIKKVNPLKNHFDVLFIGRLIKEKNVDFLIKAIKLTNLNLYIVGGGPEKDNLTSLVKRLDLRSRVSFLSFVPEKKVYALMKSARIFVSPSVREGSGLTVLESLACGTPVITIDHKDNAAKNLVNKRFICKLDEKDIAKKIVESVNSKKIRSIRKENDWKDITKNLEKYYKNKNKIQN